jgi:hypothetical protein
MALTIKSFKELWSKELMPEFKKEILNELKREINKEMQYVVERFESQMHEVRNQLKTIESAQKFVSDKYDSVVEMTQTTNKELKTMQSRLRRRSQKKGLLISKARSITIWCRLMKCSSTCMRRDCLEITGIPVVPLDDPCNLVVEVCEILNVGLDENDISVAHRLRATKNTKDRIIVKFAKRSKRDEVYK